MSSSSLSSTTMSSSGLSSTTMTGWTGSMAVRGGGASLRSFPKRNRIDPIRALPNLAQRDQPWPRSDTCEVPAPVPPSSLLLTASLLHNATFLLTELTDPDGSKHLDATVALPLFLFFSTSHLEFLAVSIFAGPALLTADYLSFTVPRSLRVGLSSKFV